MVVMSESKTERQLSAEILERVRQIAGLRAQKPPFVPGKTLVPYAGRVYDEEEMVSLVESSLEFWLTAGRWHRRLEAELGRWYGLAGARLVNSGSSANLVATAALMSPHLEDRRVRPGDEIITVAAGFPTTIAPALQLGLVPVFIDVSLPTYNVDVQLLEDAWSPKTKAVMLAHTLGNPFNLDAVIEFCRLKDLWLIEDNCDASGSLFKGKKTGTYGDMSTLSFYPPHHMTMGEGGAVLTDDASLLKIIESVRDWGRDCYCPPGVDNTCGKRFDWELGTLPRGYDHKYTYSHLGFNLKVTDMQAAVGLAQIKKLDSFGNARRANWKYYRDDLADLEDTFILPEPTPHSDPSWFGFMLSVRETAAFKREDIVRHLESKKIQTRMLFAGNLVRQPALTNLAQDRSDMGMAAPYRVVGDLKVTDQVMNGAFWIGVYPGLTEEMRGYVSTTLKAFVRDQASPH